MLYLGGGGSEDDEAQLWDLVFQPGQRVTVWPFAVPSSRIPDVMAWISTALSKRGEFTVEVGDQAPDFGLANADVLAITGGNTFDLLAWIQVKNLQQPVKDFIARGGKLYGGSAGAILPGADIDICDVEKGGLDENRIGLKDTIGLDLLGGALVFPHFDTSSKAHTAVCQKWSDELGTNVIGIPEKGGLVMETQGEFLSAGPDAVMVFAPHGEPVARHSGERFPA